MEKVAKILNLKNKLAADEKNTAGKKSPIDHYGRKLLTPPSCLQSMTQSEPYAHIHMRRRNLTHRAILYLIT